PHSIHVILAVSVLILLVSLVLFGIRQSNQVNSIVVGITLCTLSLLIMAGVAAVLMLPDFNTPWNAVLSQKSELDSAGNMPHDFSSLSFTSVHWSDFLEATALMFVAFTGYGRIATLGEEVKRPRTTIPRAIAITMLISVLVYMGISFTALSTLGTERLYRATMEQAAPLEIVARQLETAFANQPGLWRFLPAGILTAAILVGAITAMTGVLLNLVLALSRVLLAMGRRKDLPVLLTRVHPENGAPRPAILVTGGIVLLLVLIGSVKLAWTFSALTVLFYYGITNLAALRLQSSERLYPAWVSICGLIGCLFLVVFIDGRAWLAGAIILAIGFGIRSLSNFYQNR
ncbi:MAG: amino acid permease, partial [Leptospiraceae bacterium]|nr:amino acid permease [Leptospiraceae bacterium]